MGNFYRVIKNSFTILLLLILIGNSKINAQHSVLINFGGNTCSASLSPSFSLIQNPLTTNPILLSNCDMSLQQPDIFAVFIAYNPKNNKVYVADIRSGTDTKIWVLDVGLPNNIGCPINIPATPTYSYSYVSNNFEFDNNGDLWSFSNYNAATGQCSLDKFEVTTGQVINTRILQFPAGNFPNTINSGDLCILPNGRMFATLGAGPSRLYEITNYNTLSNASATYLTTLPRDCYGIAYLNGILEVSGNDFNGSCYYFDYNISTEVLGTEKPFQVNNSPIDNTSFSPSIGCTKRLLNATRINRATYDLTYEIHLENMGNVVLNNVTVTDDLGSVFGSANVTNVQAQFVSGNNNAGLVLNPLFNGTTVTSVLFDDQYLPNKISNNGNHFAKILVSCRVTNIQDGITYYNSATATGKIGSSINNTSIIIKDSSNNGDNNAIDPNFNGNPAEFAENIPTPFSVTLLPVKFIDVSASLINKSSSFISWSVATPMINSNYFTIEYSSNASDWSVADTIKIVNLNQQKFSFVHLNIPYGKIFYRIKEADIDGKYCYSKIVSVRNENKNYDYDIFPNPANNYLHINSLHSINQGITAEIFDAAGKKVLYTTNTNNLTIINVSGLSEGIYVLKIKEENMVEHKKIIIKHF